MGRFAAVLVAALTMTSCGGTDPPPPTGPLDTGFAKIWNGVPTVACTGFATVTYPPTPVEITVSGNSLTARLLCSRWQRHQRDSRRIWLHGHLGRKLELSVGRAGGLPLRSGVHAHLEDVHAQRQRHTHGVGHCHHVVQWGHHRLHHQLPRDLAAHVG